MKDLETLRTEIAALDKQIVALVAERMKAVEQVAEYKKANGLPVVNKEVEKKVVSRYGDTAEEFGADPEMMKRLASFLINEAVEMENRLME